MTLPVTRNSIPRDRPGGRRCKDGSGVGCDCATGVRRAGWGGAEGEVARADFEDAGECDFVSWVYVLEFGNGEDVVGSEEVTAAEKEGRDVMRRLRGEKCKRRGSAKR